MIKISIHGSCVSRDIFRFDKHEQFKVVNYIGRNSIISSSYPPVSSEVFNAVTDSHKLPWEERMIYFDYKKTALDKLVADECDYLVIDLIDERFGILESDKGCLTYSQVLQRSSHLGELGSYKIRDVKENTDEFYDAYKRYATFLREHFDVNRIIIHEAYPVLNYISNDNQLTLFDSDEIGKSKRLCQKIRRGYELLYELLPEAKVLRMPPNTIAYENHAWGKAPVHYVDDYYIYMLSQIDDIAKNQSSRKAACLSSFMNPIEEVAIANRFQDGLTFKSVDNDYQYVRILEGLEKGKLYKIHIEIAENFVPYELAIYDFANKIYINKKAVNKPCTTLLFEVNCDKSNDCSLLLYNGLISHTRGNCMSVGRISTSIIAKE